MEVEQIIEMFPSKNEQRIAQRIIETLKVCPDSNAIQISDTISPNKSASARMAECKGLSHILDGLRALGVISRTVDNFSLIFEKEAAASRFFDSRKAKTRYAPVKRGQTQYVVFVCENCGTAVGSHSYQRSATCKTCNHKNKIDNEHKVLLRTNSFLELQSAIQQAKYQKAANKLTLC